MDAAELAVADEELARARLRTEADQGAELSQIAEREEGIHLGYPRVRKVGERGQDARIGDGPGYLQVTKLPQVADDRRVIEVRLHLEGTKAGEADQNPPLYHWGRLVQGLENRLVVHFDLLHDEVFQTGKRRIFDVVEGGEGAVIQRQLRYPGGTTKGAKIGRPGAYTRHLGRIDVEGLAADAGLLFFCTRESGRFCVGGRRRRSGITLVEAGATGEGKGQEPWVTHRIVGAEVRHSKQTTIAPGEVVTVRPTATAIYAGELMRADKLGCLPVTEEDGRLVGIVTLSDYLRLSVEFLRAHRQVED